MDEDERLTTDEVGDLLSQRIRELEAERDNAQCTNATCPICKKKHFTLLADKTCSVCESWADKERIRELEEENMQWAKEVSRLREELNTQDTEITQLRAVIESQLEGE